MKLNSQTSIENGLKLLNAYNGSWAHIREASERLPSGILKVPEKPKVAPKAQPSRN